MQVLEAEPIKLSLRQRVGKYHLVELLGSGAFANIYLGQHCYLGTYAAVKVLRKQLTEEQRGRFLKEARIAAQLVHPQIIRVLDFGVDQGIPYLVMDYAAYGSLREYCPIGECLGREEILEYARDIAEALEYIHEQEYIHQDLKPENLLFGSDGRVLVSDFGVAIAVQETWERPSQEIVGTLPYMAPEQIMGQPCIASDQYALGVIIYEWICGEVPFDGKPQSVAWLHLNAQPPRLCEQVPGLPVAVERVVLRALEKDPQKRFSSIFEFVEQLVAAWDIKQPLNERISFYNQATYDTDAILEIPELELIAREGALEKSEARVKKPRRKSWKSIASIFALDCLLSIAAWGLMHDASNWSLPVLVLTALMAGLPFCAGQVLQDQRPLKLGSLKLGLGFVSVLLFHGPLAFVGASIVVTTLSALVAFTLYLHF